MLRDVWSFDFAAGKWTELITINLDLPAPRFAHAGAVLGNTLYIFGGITFLRGHGSYSVLNDLWSFSLATNTWRQEVLEVDFMRSFHTLHAVLNQLHTFGGYVVYSSPSAAFVYNDYMVGGGMIFLTKW